MNIWNLDFYKKVMSNRALEHPKGSRERKFYQNEAKKKCRRKFNTKFSRCGRKPLKREDLIKQFRQIHGDKYDYSMVPEGAKSLDIITIICPVHGAFRQKVVNHKYYSCRSCSTGRRLEKKNKGAVKLCL